MDAFDADVLIYSIVPGHPLGRRVLALLAERTTDDIERPAGVGSVLLLPEMLTKPTRDGSSHDMRSLTAILGRLDLRPVDHATARLAVALGAEHRLRATDAVHLAAAVAAGADRFITNNRRDFDRSIVEVEVVYPEDLADPG